MIFNFFETGPMHTTCARLAEVDDFLIEICFLNSITLMAVVACPPLCETHFPMPGLRK